MNAELSIKVDLRGRSAMNPELTKLQSGSYLMSIPIDCTSGRFGQSTGVEATQNRLLAVVKEPELISYGRGKPLEAL
jgi:hypothetical protein